MCITTLFLPTTLKVIGPSFEKDAVDFANVTIAYKANGGDPSGWTLPDWSISLSESFMKDSSIKTTIFSLTAPGTTVLHGLPAAQLARHVNEYGAAIRDSNPSKFGFFAALPPLCDGIEPVLEEIRYALVNLKADGVTLYTRYGSDNHYLGHSDFRPVWAELNSHQAVVFIHPTHAADTRLVNPSLPQPMIDYPHETTRTAVDLIISGVVSEYSACKIILSHAGGTFPYLATRAATMLFDSKLSTKSTEEFWEDARTFYFDLALSGNEYTMGLLTKFAKPDHILFGSDFPYAPRNTIDIHTQELDRYQMSSDQSFEINRGNALSLFPRLQGLSQIKR